MNHSIPRASGRRRFASVLAGLWLLSLVGIMAGCGSVPGTLTVHGPEGAEPIVKGRFTTAVYSLADPNNLTVVLLDGEVDDPRQAVTIRLFWQPKAGRTPVDPASTNATLQYVRFIGRDVGIYSGAGFLWPEDEPGAEMFEAELRRAQMAMTAFSDDYEDTIGQAKVEGRFAARRDDVAAAQILRELNHMVFARLGYPRLIQR